MIYSSENALLRRTSCHFTYLASRFISSCLLTLLPDSYLAVYLPCFPIHMVRACGTRSSAAGNPGAVGGGAGKPGPWIEQLVSATDYQLTRTSLEAPKKGGGLFGGAPAQGRLVMDAVGARMCCTALPQGLLHAGP